jgi:hypothetical protein
VAIFGTDAAVMAQHVALGGSDDSLPIGFSDACNKALIPHLYKSHYGSARSFPWALLALAAGSLAPLDLPIFTSLHL